MKKWNPVKATAYIMALVGSLQFVVAQNTAEKFTKVKELGGIEEYLYTPNGMNVLLLQDNSAPVVTVQVVYRVGSKHEVPGNTGSTHLLEHLMFKGTERHHKSKGTSIDSKLTGIGARMNATTWNDRTNYYETIPSDQIEMALDIEADRMRNSLLRKEDKDAEMTVVRNEYERDENNPSRVLSKEIWATAYMAHSYHHSTIGWRSDIEKMPIEVLRNFYNTYYWPDNATLTIIGDFEKENVFGLVDKYFGKIGKAPHKMPQPYTEEPPQYGPRRVVVKKPGQQGVITIGYKIPGRMHEDLPALEVLAQAMGAGTSSLINKTFVDTGLALSGNARASKFQDPGMFTVNLNFSPGIDYDSVHAQIVEMVNKMKQEGVAQSDVDRIIAKLNARTLLSRDGSGSIAGQLNEAIAGGDWTDYVLASERLSKVTAADVKRVANTYLVEDQSTTGYFVPKVPGSNRPAPSKAANFTDSHAGQYYYRHPEYQGSPNSNTQRDVPPSEAPLVGISTIPPTLKSDAIKERFNRSQVAGIDVITTKTGAKGFLTVSASFPIDQYINSGKNTMVPSLTAQMLSKGTTKNDKFQFSQKLEKLGVNISIRGGNNTINIGFKCLKKDLKAVVDLLAEELRYPLFDAKEFDLLKKQFQGGMKRGLSNPETLASIAMSQAIYPQGHPNYSKDIPTSVEEVGNAALEDLKAFHKTYFGPKGMHFVAVGDVDMKTLEEVLASAFKGWNGGAVETLKYEEPSQSDALTKVITVPQKPSATLIIGQFTGIERNDDDYMPFFMGTSILGGGFSGRLMRTVRDEQGLTYGISARHAGHNKTGGYWSISASFNPGLFQKGLDATMEQLQNWTKNGVTKEELKAKKSNLTGSFKVGLETTTGLARTILGFVNRGLEPDYIFQYPKDIEAVTLDQVNNAIKKYVDLDKLVIIKSGSLDQEGKPLTAE